MTRTGLPLESDLTAERVRALLIYSPETGYLYWRETRPAGSRGRPRKPGRAGHLGAGGYRDIRVDGVLYREHRVIFLLMTGKWPTHFVDHRNGVRSENWWDNIREATRPQNGQNRGLNKDNTSGFIGVHPDPRGKGWRAQITVDGVQKYLGRFDSVESAREAYLSAKRSDHDFQPTPRGQL